jgi:hypothetical protein
LGLWLAFSGLQQGLGKQASTFVVSGGSNNLDDLGFGLVFIYNFLLLLDNFRFSLNFRFLFGFFLFLFSFARAGLNVLKLFFVCCRRWDKNSFWTM